MNDAKVRRVENGFIVTVGEGDDGQPAPQYVAADFDDLCKVLREIFGEPTNGEG